MFYKPRASMARRKLKQSNPTSPRDKATLEDEHAGRKTLLMESGKVACFMALCLYMACQCFVYFNGLSEHSICTYQKEFTYSETSKFVSLLATFAFGIGCLVHLSYAFAEGYCKSFDGPNFPLHATTFTVNFIAGSSSFIQYFYEFGGICKDSFGVVSPASQWPEWITSVPLLVYVALSIDSRRSKLKTKDCIVITSMATCILAGYMLQLPISKLWSCLILICAHLCILSTILMIHRDHHKDVYLNERADAVKLSAKSVIGNKTLELEVGRITNAIKTRTLAYLLFFVFPIFPLVHVMALVGFIDADMTFIAWQVAGVFAKLVFVALAVRSHRNVFDSIVALVDKEVQPMIQTIVEAVDVEDWTDV